MKIHTVVLFAVLACSTARAGSGSLESVQDLRNHCIDDGGAGSLICSSYILGFATGFNHALSAIAVSLDESATRDTLAPVTGICLPSGWSVGQGVAVFVKWADDNPEQWHLLPSFGLVLAFREAFPCSEE
jgi:hypothetical protein